MSFKLRMLKNNLRTYKVAETSVSLSKVTPVLHCLELKECQPRKKLLIKKPKRSRLPKICSSALEMFYGQARQIFICFPTIPGMFRGVKVRHNVPTASMVFAASCCGDVLFLLKDPLAKYPAAFKCIPSPTHINQTNSSFSGLCRAK
ncbi:hypothetical protein XENOCAPTIV_000633 [Xenoophorus captivus]|uniref:Uncharacterized protein n=1 Tax=Xenoophorus captivus TaxID=1517983 RepID=A0ABV0SEV8_9TELE